jgi:hypothetical protein
MLLLTTKHSSGDVGHDSREPRTGFKAITCRGTRKGGRDMHGMVEGRGSGRRRGKSGKGIIDI